MSETLSTHPLSKPPRQYELFPLDEYTPAGIIAYQQVDIEPTADSQDQSLIPSVRFLFSNGTIRQWTKWFRISYHERAALPRVFSIKPSPDEILTDDDKLFNMPFKILVEGKNNSEYTEITRVKNGEGSVDHCIYDKQYQPYKTIKVYKQFRPLNLMVMKVHDNAGNIHILTVHNNDMLDPPANQ